ELPPCPVAVAPLPMLPTLVAVEELSLVTLLVAVELAADVSVVLALADVLELIAPAACLLDMAVPVEALVTSANSDASSPPHAASSEQIVAKASWRGRGHSLAPGAVTSTPCLVPSLTNSLTT